MLRREGTPSDAGPSKYPRGGTTRWTDVCSGPVRIWGWCPYPGVGNGAASPGSDYGAGAPGPVKTRRPPFLPCLA